MSETLSQDPDGLGVAYTTLAPSYPAPGTPSSTVQDAPSGANLPPFSTFSSDMDSGGAFSSVSDRLFSDTRLLDISNWDYYTEARLLDRGDNSLSIITSQPQYRPWESKPIDASTSSYAATTPVNTFADAFAQQNGASKLPSFQSQFQSFNEPVTTSETTLTTLTNLTPVSPNPASPQSLTPLNSNFHTLSAVNVNPRSYPLVPAPIQAREIPSIQQQFLDERHIQLYSHPPANITLNNALHPTFLNSQNGAIIQNNQLISSPTVVTVIKSEPDLKLTTLHQDQIKIQNLHPTQFQNPMTQIQNSDGAIYNGIEKKINGNMTSPTRNDFRKKERRKIRTSSLESSLDSDGASSNMEIGSENSGQVAAVSSTAGFKAHQMHVNSSVDMDTDISGGSVDKQVKKKRKRCGECIGCQRKDNCGDCAPCRNDKSHQICKQRRCEKLTEKKSYRGRKPSGSGAPLGGGSTIVPQESNGSSVIVPQIQPASRPSSQPVAVQQPMPVQQPMAPMPFYADPNRFPTPVWQADPSQGWAQGQFIQQIPAAGQPIETYQQYPNGIYQTTYQQPAFEANTFYTGAVQVLTNPRPPSASNQQLPPPRPNSNYAHTPSPNPQQQQQQPVNNGRQYQEYAIAQQPGNQQQQQQQQQQNFIPSATTPTGNENQGGNSRPGSVNSATSNQNFNQQSQHQQAQQQQVQQQQPQQANVFTTIGDFSPNPSANFANTSSGNAQPGYPQVNSSSPQLASHSSSGYPGQEQYGGQEHQQWQNDGSLMWDQQQIKIENEYDHQDHGQYIHESPGRMDNGQGEMQETKTFSQSDKVNLNTRIKTMILNKQQQENNKMEENKTAEQNSTGHFLWYSHHHHLTERLSDDGGSQNKPDYDITTTGGTDSGGNRAEDMHNNILKMYRHPKLAHKRANYQDSLFRESTIRNHSVPSPSLGRQQNQPQYYDQSASRNFPQQYAIKNEPQQDFYENQRYDLPHSPNLNSMRASPQYTIHDQPSNQRYATLGSEYLHSPKIIGYQNAQATTEPREVFSPSPRKQSQYKPTGRPRGRPRKIVQGAQNENQQAVIHNKPLPQNQQYQSPSTPTPLKNDKIKSNYLSPVFSEKVTNKQLGMEIPDCKCFSPGEFPVEPGSYYTHLGCANSLKSLRYDLECRTGVTGVAIRIEKIRYTGKEGKTAQGCPIAKWIIRRQNTDEKYLVIVKHRKGHTCHSAFLVICLVAWEGVEKGNADDLYNLLTEKLNKFGLPTKRRCATNEPRTCACQGFDENTCGASFSFGCSWSMYYNGCKFTRSKDVRKFRLSEKNEEIFVEEKLQKLANHLSPMYRSLAPQSFKNQCHFENIASDCRLGHLPGRPFSGVTACVDFCAHAHKDLHNMVNGCTVVVTLTKHRSLSKPLEEQLHVLPMYVAEDTDEFGSRESQEDKVRTGGIEILQKYSSEVRTCSIPAEKCLRRGRKSQDGKRTKRKTATPQPSSPSVNSPSSTNSPKERNSNSEIQNGQVSSTVLGYPNKSNWRYDNFSDSSNQSNSSFYNSRNDFANSNSSYPNSPSPSLPQFSVFKTPMTPNFSNHYSHSGYLRNESPGEYQNQNYYYQPPNSSPTPHLSNYFNSYGNYSSHYANNPFDDFYSNSPAPSNDYNTPPPDEKVVNVSQTDNAECFRDSEIGGVAIALPHGSVLFECAKHEMHATTALKNPNRLSPTRISLVFYQHRSLNKAQHGLDEYAEKMRRKVEIGNSQTDLDKSDDSEFKLDVSSLGSLKNDVFLRAPTIPTVSLTTLFPMYPCIVTGPFQEQPPLGVPDKT
ncbi:ten-Eleven Translocation (TET) family protein isoform X2 [Leptinotarsa decemlineata]|uniref:ten-Eleven Translocation (TET) family protein isoform X2 n=1 Tax=Leptinotarsa decemlineata TaxID=7539 RepID=UPI003D30AE31